MKFTLFADLRGRARRECALDWPAFAAMVRELPEYARKDAAPLIVLARFGDAATAKGSLRHGANVLEIDGVEIDHDAGTMTPAGAAEKLRAAGLRGVIYTSASNAPDRPRWRALLPTSRPLPPEERHRLAGVANRILEGAAAPESFNLAQAFYLGRVTGVPFEAHTVEGARCIDEVEGVEPLLPPERSREAARRQAQAAPAGADPVLKILRALAWYRREDGPGVHFITCPWIAEHPGGVQQRDSTARFCDATSEPGESFTCLDGACAGRGIDDFREKLREAVAAHVKAAVRTAEDLPAAKLRELLHLIAAAGLDDLEAEDIISAIVESRKAARSITARLLRNQLREARRAVQAAAPPETAAVMRAVNVAFAGGAHIKRIAGTTWTYREGVWAPAHDEFVRGVLAAQTRKPFTDASWRALCDELAARESQDDPLKLLDEIPLPVVTCRNAELRFDAAGSMTVHENDPALFRTVRVDTVYDPAATCPLWDAFIERVVSQFREPDEMRRHLEELMGYVIQPCRWLKTWIVFRGVKDTGKSTALKMLTTLLGDAALARPTDAMMNERERFSNVQLIGKLCVYDDDLKRGTIIDDGSIKKLSEAKRTSGEVKFGGVVHFVSRAVPVTLCNHWPKTRDVTSALLDRVQAFEFSRRVPPSAQSDQQTAAMFNETSGVLNRLLAGLSRLRARGRWDPPAECLEARERFLQKSNRVAEFVRECLVTDPAAPAARCMKRSHVWSAFESWLADGGGMARSQWTPRGLYEVLEDLGFEAAKSAGEWHIVGIVGERKTRQRPPRPSGFPWG